MTISLLIADDSAGVRAAIRVVIGDLAHRVVECEDGLVAVALYQETMPDWVLMDLQMPRLDGISATRRIRHLDPNARIVIVTDFGDTVSRQTAREAGAVAFVSKDDLFALVDVLKPPERD
jgi:two-component system, NarL family, response regulator